MFMNPPFKIISMSNVMSFIFITFNDVDVIHVGEPGFEPGTSCSQSRRASQLRYSPNASSMSKISIVLYFLLCPPRVLMPTFAETGTPRGSCQHSPVPLLGAAYSQRLSQASLLRHPRSASVSVRVSFRLFAETLTASPRMIKS